MIWAFYVPNIVVATGEYLRGRGEYFYLSRYAHSGFIFFLCAEIFNLECFVQKYSYYGVLCKNIGQVLLHVSGMLP